MKLIRSIFIIFVLLIFAFLPPKIYADDPCDPIANGPLLYQVNRTPTAATLYFTPINNDQVTNYAIIYGFKTEDERFSTTFNYGVSTGAISYTVNDLQPGVQYFYKVRGSTNCVQSPWSSWEGDKPVTSGSSIAIPGIPVTGPESFIFWEILSVMTIFAGCGILIFSTRKPHYY